MASLQIWEVISDVKDVFKDHEKRLLDHLRAKLGIVPALVMPNNKARLLFDSKNERVFF